MPPQRHKADKRKKYRKEPPESCKHYLVLREYKTEYHCKYCGYQHKKEDDPVTEVGASSLAYGS